MAKDFYKSNYGINKHSKGIVYKYADGSILEITFEKIAAGNPSFTKDDFDKIKDFSDKLYHEEAKNDCNYHHHIISNLDDNTNSKCISIMSFEDELMEQYDKNLVTSKLQEAINNTLTPVQKRRIIMYFFDGLTYREIAEAEGASAMSIYESIQAAQEKLKNFLKNLK